MDFLYENVNPYELVNYYKDIHEYYQKHKQNIYNILTGLENEIIIEENNKEEQKNDGDFSNFYFFYIQNLKVQERRGTFRLVNVRQLNITNADDFLVGLNFSKLDIGSDVRIYLTQNNSRRKTQIFRTILTEKNRKNIFLPLNNKNFFPFFLLNNNYTLTIISNKGITSIDAIYLKLHRNYSNKFFNFGCYLLKYTENSYFEFKDFNLNIIYNNQEILPNEFLFYWNLEKYYGRKIFNFIKKYKLKKFIKEFVTEEYDIYDDISNTLCKFI